MTEHEKLMENYEDAIMRLLMDRYAREEGERALTHLDPEPSPAGRDGIADTLRRRCRRERLRRGARRLGGALGHAAAFAAVTGALFSTAFAASETVIAVVRLGFGPSAGGEAALLLPAAEPGFEAGWLPWGFELKYSDDSPTRFNRYYADLSGNFIDASCLYLHGGELTVDTGDAAVTTVDVCGRRASLLRLEGGIRLVLPVEEQDCAVLLMSSGVSEEDLLRTARALIFPWDPRAIYDPLPAQ